MADSSLWPMAIDYCVYHHYHITCASAVMMALIDLILWTQAPHSNFKNIHIWGCPCCVLKLSLHDGHKLPKWKLCSQHAIFVSFSPCHSSLVLLVLNTHSGKILPQFHIIFDDWYTRVLSMGADNAFDPQK